MRLVSGPPLRRACRPAARRSWRIARAPGWLALSLALLGRPAAARELGADGVRLAPATPGAVRFTVSVPAPLLSRVDQEQKLDRLDLSGYTATGAPGAPALPSRTLLVAVPPLGDVRLTTAASETSVLDGVTLAPAPGLDRDGHTVAAPRSAAAYGTQGESAPAGARLLDVTWLRNQRVARVLVSPAAYEPAARRLTVARRVDVELAVTNLGPPGPPAEAVDPFESVYRLSLVNYEQGRAWRRPRTAALASAAGRLGLPLAADAALVAPPDTSRYAGRRWIKFAIRKTGFYCVNFSRLRQSALFGAGSAVPFDSLRLFTWPGRTVLPENSYCDSCDYREVAIGIGVDVSTDNGHPKGDGPPDGKFADNGDKFFFFAQGPDGWESDMDDSRPDTSFIDHPYDSRNFYYLTVATDNFPVSDTTYPVPPRRIGTDATNQRSVLPDGSETPVATVAGRLHLEEDHEYWPDATAIGTTLVWEKWFWQSSTPGPPFPIEAIDVPDADVTQPARFRLRMWGLSDSHSDFRVGCGFEVPDHILDVSINDVVFPRRTWNQLTAQTYDTTATYLKKRGNQLTVTVPDVGRFPDCPGRLDRSGLAFYEIYYERLLEPSADAIDFRTHAGTGRFQYTIGPFVKTPPSFLFDVTRPLEPVQLTGAVETQGSGGPMLVMADTQSVSHRYVVVPDSILLQDSALLQAADIADAPQTSLENLRSATQGADDLIIYFDGFKEAADTLAAWRSAHLPLIATPAPHIARAIPISALYDQFSGGRTDPGAIRNFLRAAAGWSRRPLYVTFLGDASFDYKDITGRAAPGQPGCLLPTFENNFDDQPVIRRQYSTDDWLVNVNDPVNVLPDYLVGRIPAAEAATALTVVRDKLIAYERQAPFGEYRNTLILMADDDVQGSDCAIHGDCDPLCWTHVQQTTDLDVQNTPAHMDRDYVYLHTFEAGPGGGTRPGARVQLFKDLNAGAAMFNYVGHGSPFKMTDEGVLLDTDAGTLTNGLRMSLLIAASCDVGKFNDPSVQSLGERMFVSAGSGSIAVISATEQALSNLNSFLDANIYDALFDRDTLTAGGVFLPSVGQYHVPISAALVVAKYRPGQGANSQKYQLMGDPGTLLNLPRQWAELTLDSAGAPVDSLTRGQTVHFSGRVLDRPGGSPVALDGVASILIEDSAPTNQTPDECSTPVSYRFSAGPMYHGDVTIKAGQFSGKVVVPMDATTGTEGRVRAYVDGRMASIGETDGAGAVRVRVTPGAGPPADDQGPRITLSFVGGSTSVRPDATLQINLFDEHGIMTTGHAPQNSIVVTVDDNTTSRTDVTQTFRYAADSYQSGTATFRLPGLSPGGHRVKVSAADNLATGLSAVDHRSSATIDFQVVSAPPLHIARTFAFPNPIRSRGVGNGGVIVVDAPGDSINVLIRVYTVAGRLVRVLRQMGGIGQVQVPWDGLDAEGDPLAQGTYLYKVYVGIRDADGKTSPRQNATAEGRFVVLNR